MRKIDLEELRNIQIDILSEIDEFCADNNIQYYMCYGTLLGAVRHKGYIPWDDDIDIVMPYDDYIRFCSEFHSDYYRVHVWFKDRDFFCNYAKVEDIRTIQMEQVDSKFTIGINIDIAPMIGLPANYKKAVKYYEKIVVWRKILNLKQLTLREGRAIHKQLLVIVSKAVLRPLSYYSINRHIDKLAGKYIYNKSKYVIPVGSFNPSKEIFERKKFGDTISLIFEDRFFKAPKGYDDWLKQIFGDYMKLPPEKNRVSHHSFKTFWKE